jgi:hypothetical protein
MQSNNKDDAVITFSATVSKVTTLADGGIRVVLDLSESAIDTATKMMQAKQAGAVLEIAVIPVKSKNNW